MKKRIYLTLLFLAGTFLLASAAYAMLSISGTYALRVPAAPPPEGGQVSARLATGELLTGYRDYLDLSSLEEGDLRVAFTSNMRFMSFRVVTLGYDDGIYVSGEVIVQKELFPGRPIVVTWPEQGDVPHRGISFVDENDETRYFVLETAGDGFLLVEFNN